MKSISSAGSSRAVTNSRARFATPNFSIRISRIHVDPRLSMPFTSRDFESARYLTSHRCLVIYGLADNRRISANDSTLPFSPPTLSLLFRVHAEGESPPRKSIAISARRDKGFFLITILLARYRRSGGKVRGSGTKDALAEERKRAGG